MVSHPTVAVVGDDSRGDTVRALEKSGYTVRQTTRVVPADVDNLLTNDVACLVMDVDAPNADSLGVVERVRETASWVRVVAYTEFECGEVTSRAATTRVDECVPASRGLEELVDAVDRSLGRDNSAQLLSCGEEARTDGQSILTRATSEMQQAGQIDGKRGERRDLEHYQTIVETVDDMIYTLDAEGTLTYVNRVFADYFGYTREQAIGTDVAEVLPVPAYEAGTELIMDLLKEDVDCGRYEFRLERPDGEVHILENNVVIYRDDDYLHGSAGVIRDVTRRTDVERELRRQNERLEEFADIVGHDLRNPLNVIQGQLELYRETGDSAHLEELEACTDHMEALLADLLEFARNGRDVDSTERLDLEAAACEAWSHVDTGEATLEAAGNLGTIEADPTRLGQLLENLFRNAVEHGSTSPRSQPHEDAVEHGGQTVAVEWTAEGFAVADDGPGLDPAVGDRIFERGVSTRTGGTGFGLSIVSSIVDAHGWSIDLDDEYDEGARFVVTT